jgi:HEAT repeat protein
MSRIVEIYKLLRESTNPAADDALLEAMCRAEPPIAEAAARVLLTREQTPGLTGVVQAFDRLPTPIQQAVVGRIDRLFPALRQCIRSEEAQVCKNTITIIAQGGNQRLGYLLSPCLTHISRNVRETAAAALVQLGKHHLDQLAQLDTQIRGEIANPTLSLADRYALIAAFRDDRRYLVSVLEQGLDNYDVHLRSEILEVILWFADSFGSKAWTRATGPGSKCGRGMIECFLSSHDPRLACATYKALMYSELRQAVIRMVGRCRDTEFFEALAAQSWMLCIPRIRRGFGSIRELAWLETAVDSLLELEPDTAIRIMRVLMATGIPADTKVDLLRELLLVGRRPLQRAALWALLEIDTEPATETLRLVLSWDDHELSPIALTELMRRQPQDLTSLMVSQLNSRTSSVREVAEDHVAEDGFDRYWITFESLAEATREEASRAMAKVVPDLPRRLRIKLRSSQPSDRLRAVLIARMLGLTQELQEYIYRLSHDRDNAVRSAAVAALGQLRDRTAERITHQALDDRDARVRANAVEALDEMQSPRLREAIAPKLEAEDHRVRANAVKALLRMHIREAAETLMDMLDHHSHLHRTSGLWVIERLGLATMIDRVIELAEKDPHPAVRARAARICQALQSHRALAEVLE